VTRERIGGGLQSWGLRPGLMTRLVSDRPRSWSWSCSIGLGLSFGLILLLLTLLCLTGNV